MSRWTVIRLVAGREVRQRARSKAFLVSAGVSLLFILAVAVIPGLVGDGPTTYDVAVGGPRAEALGERLHEAAAAVPGDVEVKVWRGLDPAEAERLVTAGELDAYLDERRVVVDEELGDRLGALVHEAHQQVTVAAGLRDAGVADEVAAAVLTPVPLVVRPLDAPDEAASDREGLVAFGTFLLYGQMLGFGFWVASGVVEEKASRVVELLLAKASPSQLLTGKIVGIGALAFAQLVGFVAIGLVAAQVSGSVDLPAGTPGIAAQVPAWFVLGFAFYSCLFAVGGALASRVEEMQNTSTPLTTLAMVSLFAAIFTSGDPSGPVARIATFVPSSAPMVLPIRSAAGEIAAWEVALSVAVVLVSIVAAVKLAARVYAGGALHTRGQLKLRDALKAGRPTVPAKT